MTVRELIELLKDHDPDAEVRMAHPAHDYWRNTIAAQIDDVEEEYVVPSEYHGDSAFKVLDESECIEREERGEPEAKIVVLIR